MSKPKLVEIITVDDGEPIAMMGLPPPDSGMDRAPRDGRWCEVTEDGGTWTRVRFYQTRMRIKGSVAWVSVSCWSTSEPSRYANRIDHPVAWRWPGKVAPP